jgi:hypothetical protein
MKVYGLPDEVPAPKVDYSNFDPAKFQRDEQAHTQCLKDWLVSKGWSGKHTGKILYMPMGDGAAAYMLADGPKSCLIHLPYGDAWNHPDAKFLPKSEVLRRIGSSAKINAIFADKKKVA